MTENSRLRPALWAAAALCLVSALVAIPIVGGDDDRDGAGGWIGTTGSGGETPTTAVAGDATAPEADGGGGGGDSRALGGPSAVPGARTDRAGGGTPTAASGSPADAAATTTAAPAAAVAQPQEDLGTPQDPGPTVPPRPGTYRYKARRGDQSLDTTTAVEDKGTTPLETRQIVRMRGGGLDSDSDVSWRKDGLYVLSSDFQFGQSRGTCDWEPDFLQLRLPLAKGTTWESSSSCTITGLGPTPIIVSRKLTARVVELRRTRVAGRILDVWAIEGTDHFEFAGNVIDASGTTLFSPKHGLSVSSAGKAKGSGPNGSQETDTSSEIQNLDPE